jgi:hypothetical protein
MVKTEQAIEVNLSQNQKTPPTCCGTALIEHWVCQMLALAEQGMGDNS